MCIRDVFIIIGRAKRAPHWAVQLRFRVIYIRMYVGLSTKKIHMPKIVGGRGPNTRMLKVSLGRLELNCDTHSIHFDYTLEQL